MIAVSRSRTHDVAALAQEFPAVAAQPWPGIVTSHYLVNIVQHGFSLAGGAEPRALQLAVDG